MEIMIPTLSVVICGVIIASLGRMVTHALTQKHLYETFLENQFKQESAFTRMWLNGTNDGSHTPAPSSQDESHSNTTMGQIVNL